MSHEPFALRALLGASLTGVSIAASAYAFWHTPETVKWTLDLFGADRRYAGIFALHVALLTYALPLLASFVAIRVFGLREKTKDYQ